MPPFHPPSWIPQQWGACQRPLVTGRCIQACQLVVDEALRADISQPESRALESAQGHSSQVSLGRAAAATTLTASRQKVTGEGPASIFAACSWQCWEGQAALHELFQHTTNKQTPGDNSGSPNESAMTLPCIGSNALAPIPRGFPTSPMIFWSHSVPR